MNAADGQLRAVDATAGFGEDSLLLAAAGYNVELYEYDPVIAALLRDALRRAARALCEQALSGALNPAEITEDTLRQALDTHGQPDVDLVIRTSGEERMSNFLPFQAAYAELQFSPTLWPDFGVDDYHAALDNFAGRDRRFGGRNEK